MAVDKINVWADSRVEQKTAVLNGRTYSYLIGNQKDYKATVFLVHGWPDLNVGWRYQIPMLLNLGLRVVVPCQIGFGGTDAPRVPPNSIHLYGYKSVSDDFAELAKQLDAPKIILGGHDWGGMVVWRMAAYYPDLVTHVFSVCTPYFGPSKVYLPLETLAKGPAPTFGYQIQLASQEVESRVTTKDEIRRFLHAMYGARDSKGQVPVTAVEGIDFEKVADVGETKLLSPEVRWFLGVSRLPVLTCCQQEMDYYVDQYHRQGLHGTGE